ncbi:hypothetical protein RA27_03860 [Ruegeria sp. ANG-R]|uniref:type I restriction endonuclease subunit R, EcoR124 family n=1 Tax=Ruegeria sp. ANG-R TaxID=1577903 RepID=UPI00057F452B|nr:hypothetical protein [Ruegeria sp. ANG-R]KIC42509.1 hypothetical protein RA27_03860 [Ruegeria sp. ANG-R]
MTSLAEFSSEDLALDPQRFEDYKRKYLDIHDRVKANDGIDQKASIIDEVDFEFESIRRDNINVAYNHHFTKHGIGQKAIVAVARKLAIKLWRMSVETPPSSA